MSKDYKKLYEDVVALAKDGLTDGLYLSRSAKDVTEFLFPQLKKSENEKISKKLIQLLQNGGRLPDEEHKQALSWLEKQGKIKLTHYDSAEKEKSDFVNGQFIQCRKSFNEFKENESYLFEYIGDDTYIGKSDNVLDEEFYITPQQLFTLFTHQHCPKDYEKHGEQKPIDESEPKFKVDDWITNDKYTWKVTAIQPLDYILQSQNGNTVDDTISYVDEHFHLWTIQDAKDGDVLKEDSCMFIVEKMKSEGTAIIYCCLFDDGDFDLIGSTLSFDVDSTYPATKEQRDLLFQKMKEEGYEWNADNKELRKIEQIEQNPTWGGEDEKTRKAILELVKQSSHILNPMNQKSMISWLEKQGDKVDVLDDFPTEFERQISHLIASSINKEWEYKKDFVKHTANALLQYAKNELEKQGKQKPSWNEEDREMLDNCLGLIQEIDCTQEEQNWLKSLKDRFQLQPKQKWSEDDEKRINSIISSIKYCSEQYPDKKEYARDIDWLKSLKFQNRWKPSEYDISLLEEIAKNIRNNVRPFCSEVSSLEELIDNLKNL